MNLYPRRRNPWPLAGIIIAACAASIWMRVQLANDSPGIAWLLWLTCCMVLVLGIVMLREVFGRRGDDGYYARPPEQQAPIGPERHPDYPELYVMPKAEARRYELTTRDHFMAEFGDAGLSRLTLKLMIVDVLADAEGIASHRRQPMRKAKEIRLFKGWLLRRGYATKYNNGAAKLTPSGRDELRVKVLPRLEELS